MLDVIVSTKLDSETGSQIETLVKLTDWPISKVVRVMLKRHLAEHGATMAALSRTLQPGGQHDS